MKKYYTNQQIVNVLRKLQSSSEEDFFNKKVPVKLSFAFQYSIDSLADAYNKYTATLQHLLSAYDVDQSTLQTANPADQEVFTDQIQSLLSQKVGVEIQTISIKDLEQCDNPQFDSLTTKDMGFLSWLVEEEEDE